MTYRQYIDYIKICVYLRKEPQGEFKEFYDFITELWDGMEFTVINEKNILFHKGTIHYMEQNFNNGWMDWMDCHSDRVWSFFRSTKGMELNETQDFIKSMVEEHLICHRVFNPTEGDFN